MTDRAPDPLLRARALVLHDLAAYDAATPDPDTEQEVLRSSFIWSMEREVGG